MESDSQKENKYCFVVMPISDGDGYEIGHFGRVYKFVVKPACEKVGFKPIRADEIQRTNHIIIDVLKRVIEADMVICDLSSKNPNVMYELGIRQAFNLPVTLIKDTKTERIFDIQGLRDIEYDESLRIDKTEEAITRISETLINTHKSSEGDINSIIQLLGVKPASITSSLEVSKESSLILQAISDIGRRVSSIEDEIRNNRFPVNDRSKWQSQQSKNLADFSEFAEAIRRIEEQNPWTTGNRVHHNLLGDGEIIGASSNGFVIQFDSGITKPFEVGDKHLKILE